MFCAVHLYIRLPSIILVKTSLKDTTNGNTSISNVNAPKIIIKTFFCLAKISSPDFPLSTLALSVVEGFHFPLLSHPHHGDWNKRCHSNQKDYIFWNSNCGSN